ncbi:MAG: HNH endonuclease [Trueperaceae bacterium]|nr:HNH endonuclease [Trueperaceae bacterium]
MAGVPSDSRRRPAMTLREWVDARIDRNGPGECWLWVGERTTDGYGRIHRRVVNPSGDQIIYAAHRVVYEMNVGPIPEGLVLDHLCFNPPCVNPDHLEPVTNRENLRRGIGPLCGNGHLKSLHRREGPSGTTYCGQCHADQSRRRYYARLGRPVPPKRAWMGRPPKVRDAIPEVKHEGCPFGQAVPREEDAA